MRAIAERVAGRVAAAQTPLVLTGAGMSAESGVPTFRDAQTGIWSRFDPDELATLEAFRRRPDVVFGWYLGRLRDVVSIEPHEGYAALVELERILGSLPIVTQNVDGLHGRAGSSDVTELHGSLSAFRCDGGGHPFPVEDVLALDVVGRDGRMSPPKCSSCGCLVRPGVIWFGELLPEQAMLRAEQLAVESDVVLLVGTSSVVYPAAGLPAIAQASGAFVIEINPEPTGFTVQSDLSWRARAGAALTEISRLVSSMKATL